MACTFAVPGKGPFFPTSPWLCPTLLLPTLPRHTLQCHNLLLRFTFPSHTSFTLLPFPCTLDTPCSATTSRYASPSFPTIRSRFCPSLATRNTSCSATTSRYASMCHQRRLTQDVDVVFIEFAVNDPAGPHTSMERLIRKVLQYPNRCDLETWVG